MNYTFKNELYILLSKKTVWKYKKRIKDIKVEY